MSPLRLSNATIGVDLSVEELHLIREALDAYQYHEVAEERQRNSGYVYWEADDANADVLESVEHLDSKISSAENRLAASLVEQLKAKKDERARHDRAVKRRATAAKKAAAPVRVRHERAIKRAAAAKKARVRPKPKKTKTKRRAR